MTGIDIWNLISPIISPMEHKAMNNQAFGEAYVNTYIALKEKDRVDKLREWLKSEHKEMEKVLKDENTLSCRGYVFTTKEDMINATKLYIDALEIACNLLGIDYE